MKWISTAAAVFALSTSLAMAAPHEGGKHGRHGKRGEFGAFGGERLAAKLNLTEAQKAQLKAQRETFKQQNQAFFQSSRDTFKEFRAAKKANDTARMEALKPALQANRAQMKSLRDAQRQQFLSILTADQRAQFDALKAERKEKRNRQ
jgi:Spy/CpxP family protein refolding chaperone